MLNGCAHSCIEELEKDLHIYDIDLVHGVCGKNKVVTIQPFKTVWVEDLPISQCDGFFAMAPEDTQRVKRCAESAAAACEEGQ